MCQKQEFSYDPKILELTEHTVDFRGSVHYSGRLYAVILKQSEPAPSAQQIKLGLNSFNMKMPEGNKVMITMIVDLSMKYAFWPYSDKIKFTNLFFNTIYNVYFAADRDCDGYYELIDEKSMRFVTVKTSYEEFVMPEYIKVLTNPKG